MKRFSNSILVMLLALVVCGCSNEATMPSQKFLILTMAEVTVGGLGWLSIQGVDSVFYEIESGSDVIDVSSRYSIDDRTYYHGISSYFLLSGKARGDAMLRLYNELYNLDTTVSIHVKSDTPDEPSEVYTFQPEERQFNIEEHADSIMVSGSGPKHLYYEIIGKFHMSSSKRVSRDSMGRCKSYLLLELNRVGSAYVRFYNEDIDTLLQVDILPQYTTYTEPNLDFDDTYDSVTAKLHNWVHAEGDSNNFNINGPTRYRLRVEYTDNGRIDQYDVTLLDDVPDGELSGFINERYYRTWREENGLRIYLKSFDHEYPSMDEASLVVMFDEAQNIVKYRNPANY